MPSCVALMWLDCSSGGLLLPHTCVQHSAKRLNRWSTSRTTNSHLPASRRSSVEDVRLIYTEAPILFAKACELFILKLTIWSGFRAKENKSGTLQKKDIAAAITRSAKSWDADWPASSSGDRSGLCSAHQRQRQQG